MVRLDYVSVSLVLYLLGATVMVETHLKEHQVATEMGWDVMR